MHPVEQSTAVVTALSTSRCLVCATGVPLDASGGHRSNHILFICIIISNICFHESTKTCLSRSLNVLDSKLFFLVADRACVLLLLCSYGRLFS